MPSGLSINSHLLAEAIFAARILGKMPDRTEIGIKNGIPCMLGSLCTLPFNNAN